MKLSVSILSIKDDIKNNVAKLINYDIDYLHIDIMDGLFVPNTTWNIDEVKAILPDYKNLDVHLMVNDLDKYINDFISINPKIITFHYEATCDIMKYIDLIHSHGIKAGLAIKPDTDVSSISKYLDVVDLVLVMSVEPGFGGQKFIMNSCIKMNELYNLRNENNYNYLIEVDGGVNNETISYCDKFDLVVVGSYITKNDYEESINTLRNIMDN